MGEQPLPIRFDGQGYQALFAPLVLAQLVRPVFLINTILVALLHQAIVALPDVLDGLVLASVSSNVFVSGAFLGEIALAQFH